ncbi:hypothetical protein [Leifsonia aquatica]|uniref:hypothetical protein n=1 Tax=Leifsonia aquatica TaxID=144185 RepID=UPI000469846B|nr:hypothetical protein [Leifsonia aquatica]
MRYFGVLNGSALAPSGIHDREAVVVLDSIRHAEDHLSFAHVGANLALRSHGGKTLDGEYPGDIPGGVGDGSRITLFQVPRSSVYETDDMDAGELYDLLLRCYGPDLHPDYELTVGPRGGVKIERL